MDFDDEQVVGMHNVFVEGDVARAAGRGYVKLKPALVRGYGADDGRHHSVAAEVAGGRRVA